MSPVQSSFLRAISYFSTLLLFVVIWQKTVFSPPSELITNAGRFFTFVKSLNGKFTRAISNLLRFIVGMRKLSRLLLKPMIRREVFHLLKTWRFPSLSHPIAQSH